MDIKTPGIITNEGGELRSLVGPDAIECMRLRTILIGMKTEAKGMRLTRGKSCTTMAREITGLRTRDREVLAARIQILLDQQIGKCIVVEQGEES